MNIENLSSYHRVLQRIRESWNAFSLKRAERLKQQDRPGIAAEKVTENILEDLFTTVLDWPLSDLNNQVQHSDLLLTSLGIKYLIIEAKRPGALAWNRRAVEAALNQAMRYASEQKVKCLGISDGVMLYTADLPCRGLQDRVFVSLDAAEPQEQLWWLSVHGIYRDRENRDDASLKLLPETAVYEADTNTITDDILLHPKYKLTAHCFAHIGNAADVKTWKLPYRLQDGSIDTKRLPKAIHTVARKSPGWMKRPYPIFWSGWTELRDLSGKCLIKAVIRRRYMLNCLRSCFS